MFLKELENALEQVYDVAEPRFREDQIKLLRVLLLQMIEKEGFNKSLIFKHGFMITIYGLKTNDAVWSHLKTEYINSFDTGVSPDLKSRFDFGVSAFCMKLDSDAKCRIDNAPCEYARTSQWPKCEFIYKSIKGE